MSSLLLKIHLVSNLSLSYQWNRCLSGRSLEESAQDRLRWYSSRMQAPRVYWCRYVFQVRFPPRYQTFLLMHACYYRKNNVFNYAVSVPWRKVRANEEVLLAWEMNGEPLPKIHGYPLRAVVTGYIGARSCKWLYRVNALAEPSMGPVQRQEYLYFTPQVSMITLIHWRELDVGNRSESRMQSIRMDSPFSRCPSRECLDFDAIF